jgi:acetoin utilization deacetylase AcuC-like enzyme
MPSQLPLKVFYCDTFVLPLPRAHRFPIEKYSLLRERLEASEFRSQLEFCVPDPATDEQLLLVHTPEYLNKLKYGTLSKIEERRIGLPWSPGMVERSRRSTGATIAAARAALGDGAAAHLAGGTHHAFADHGQGFCVFNDVAVAIRVLQSKGLIRRSVVIDLDVHQGNGTASIFANDPSVFTFSTHGEHNFPFDKFPGDLEIAFPNGTTDEPYLIALRDALEKRLPLADADVVFFLAGADPYEYDRYGKLKITKDGLAERDQLVFAACQLHAIPVVVVMAGGYARMIQDVAVINTTTVRQLLSVRRLH